MGRMWIQKSLTLAGAVVLATACSESPNSPNTPPIITKNLSIEGQIDTGVGASGFSMKMFGPNDLSSFAGEGKKVRCVPGSGPLVAGEGAIHATTGAFSLEMKGMEEGASLGCWIFDDGIPSMPISFGAKGSIYGGSQQLLGYAPKPGATNLKLGTIAIQSMGGFNIAVVDKEKINDNGSDDKIEFYDMKGEWAATPVTKDGFIHPCDMDDLNTEEMNACKNLWKKKIYFSETITATKGSDKAFITSIWQNKNSYDYCEGKEGLDLPGYDLLPAKAGEKALFDLTLKNLVRADLEKAKFRYSNEQDNCPLDDASKCELATNCYDLVKDITDNTEARRVGLNCVLNSLKSGGNKNVQFDFGTSCDYRLREHPTSIDTILDGTACSSDRMCGLEFYPRERFMNSELVISGNMGTTSQVEPETGYAGPNDGKVPCEIVRTQTFTITQISKTKATLQVNMSAGLLPGQNPLCAEDTTTWFYKEITGGAKILVNLTR